MELLNEKYQLKTNCTDSHTDEVFVVVASPKHDPTTYILDNTQDIKSFVVGYLWNLWAKGWNFESNTQFLPQLSEHLPILQELVGEINLYHTAPNEHTRPGHKYQYYFAMTPLSSSAYSLIGTKGNNISDNLIKEVVEKAFRSFPVELAVDWYIDRHRTELDAIADGQTLEAEGKRPALSRRKTLFSNSKDIASNQTGISKPLSDGIAKMIKTISAPLIEEQHIASRGRRVAFKTQDKNGRTAELALNKDTLGITGVASLDQCVKQLWQLKNAKILQTFHVLWNYTTSRDSAVFNNVPISELMAMTLKPSGKNKFNKEDRKAFTEALKWMDSMTITVNQIKEEYNHKTRKSKPVLTQERGIRVFQMKATYSVKKEFQSLPKDQLKEDKHFDMDVINHFSGMLLPGCQDLFADRANVYNNNLLKLDANKDGKAYILGFIIETRFNQFIDKAKPFEMSRGQMIETCDYQKTNDTKPSIATKLLKNTLDKLVNYGIISKYSGLTNNSQDIVTIYPPKEEKQIAIA